MSAVLTQMYSYEICFVYMKFQIHVFRGGGVRIGAEVERDINSDDLRRKSKWLTEQSHSFENQPSC